MRPVPHRILQPSLHRVVNVLTALTDLPRPYLEGLARIGTHVWFRETGEWEHQHSSEGGSMLGVRDHASAEEAWRTLLDAGLLGPELAASPVRDYGPPVEARCVYGGPPCEACGHVEALTRQPASFGMVFAAGCNPDGMLKAERSLGQLANALGMPPPERFVWRLVWLGHDDLEMGMLMRLVGADRPPTSREQMIHLHGEKGFHPEWPELLGYGSLPRTAVETAALAHRDGGLEAIPDDGSARQQALRALLATGNAIPCDLRAAVMSGTLLATQPFGNRDDDVPWLPLSTG